MREDRSERIEIRFGGCGLECRGEMWRRERWGEWGVDIER
jgi:hypothetical protein